MVLFWVGLAGGASLKTKNIKRVIMEIAEKPSANQPLDNRHRPRSAGGRSS